MSTVKHLKLIGGEEILGIIDEENTTITHLALKKVRGLMAQPMGQNQMGLGLVPYMMGNPDAVVRIQKDMIIGDPIDGPPKNLEDTYLQQVSGLTFASSGPGASGNIQV